MNFSYFININYIFKDKYNKQKVSINLISISSVTLLIGRIA